MMKTGALTLFKKPVTMWPQGPFSLIAGYLDES